MANWRRWNENNVDLNRNALFTKESWKNVLNRDPSMKNFENSKFEIIFDFVFEKKSKKKIKDLAGYEDIYPLINPEEPPTFWNFFKSIPSIMYFKTFFFQTFGFLFTILIIFKKC